MCSLLISPYSCDINALPPHLKVTSPLGPMRWSTGQEITYLGGSRAFSNWVAPWCEVGATQVAGL